MRYRQWSGLIVAAAFLLLSGCVWLRLLALKDQFAEFDRYVETAGEPGLELRFRQPVVEAGDLDTLLKATATAEHAAGPMTVRVYAFVHVETAEADPPSASVPLCLTVTLDDGLLRAVQFPPEVFRVIPRAHAIAAMRAMGHAAVNTAERSASVAVDAPADAPPLPTRSELVQLFGNPNRQEPLDDGRERLLWRFRLVGTSLRSDGLPVIAAIACTFRPGEDRPCRFQANVGGMWIALDLK